MNNIFTFKNFFFAFTITCILRHLTTSVDVGLHYCTQLALKSILKLVLKFFLELINLLNSFNRFHFFYFFLLFCMVYIMVYYLFKC